MKYGKNVCGKMCDFYMVITNDLHMSRSILHGKEQVNGVLEYLFSLFIILLEKTINLKIRRSYIPVNS